MVKSRKQPGFIFQSGEDYHLNSLQRKEIFFTHPKYFNDPYDCGFTIADDLSGSRSQQNHNVNDLKDLFRENYRNGLKGYWDSLSLTVDMATKIVEWCDNKITSQSLCELLEKHIKESISVRCLFQSKPRSVLMWAHYANTHTGYCVGYEIPTFTVFNVGYRSFQEEFYLSEFLFSSRNTLNKLIFNKDSSWEYEQEIRIINPNFDDIKTVPSGVNVKLDSLDIETTTIYLGSLIEEEEEKEKEKKVISIGKELGVEIYKCKKSQYSGSEFEFEKVH